MSAAAHGITAFGQDLRAVDREFPPLWTLLDHGGVRCGIFGSLQSYQSMADHERFAFYMPDVFAAGNECFPKRLEPYQLFNLAMTRDSARNVRGNIRPRRACRMLAAAPGLGIRPTTLLDAGWQLIDERLRPPRRADERFKRNCL